MKRARVTGAVTATQKDPRLVGRTLLVCAILNAAGEETDAAEIAVDTVGAGPGDLVLVAFGAAARIPQETTAAPVDAAIIAILDER